MSNIEISDKIQQEEDENDSCFAFKKRQTVLKFQQQQVLKTKSSNDEEDEADRSIAIQTKEKQESIPIVKIVNVKPIEQFHPANKIKSVVLGNKSSPVKHRIDAIAENLQKKKSINQAAPKVSLVKSVDELKNKINLTNKELAHQLILLRCNKKIDFRSNLSNQNDK